MANKSVMCYLNGLSEKKQLKFETYLENEVILTLIVKAPLSTKSNLSLERIVTGINPLFKQNQRVARTRFEGAQMLTYRHLLNQIHVFAYFRIIPF